MEKVEDLSEKDLIILTEAIRRHHLIAKIDVMFTDEFELMMKELGERASAQTH